MIKFILLLQCLRIRVQSPSGGIRRVNGPPSASNGRSSPPTGILKTQSSQEGGPNSMSISRRRSSIMSFDQPRMVSRVRLPKENSWSLFWSTLGLLVFFVGALLIAAIAQIGVSMNWI